MVEISELASFLDIYLNADKYQRDSNGLILGGARKNIYKVAGVVNLSQICINEIIKRNYDFIVSHHAAWKSTDARLAGIKYDLLQKHGIGLYVAHDSLDYHQEVGTTKSLVDSLGWKVVDSFFNGLGLIAEPNSSFPDAIQMDIKRILKGKVEVFHNNPKWDRIGIIPGWGARPEWIEAAAENGINTFFSGEAIHFGKVFANETSINLILAGHYATEVPGIKSMLEKISSTYEVETRFFDDDVSIGLF